MTEAGCAVSVLIPTRNGMATLPALLAALRAQVCPFEWELVAIDSGSSDGSAELLAREADRLLHVAPGEFDHGLTRNRGIEACRGGIVALLVQDAEPADGQWLAELVAPLVADPEVAGTFARQLPRPGASAISRHALAGWRASSPEPRRVTLEGAAALARLTPLARLDLCAFDDVSSAIRRSVWEQIPFRAAAIAEDLEWGRDVLLAGHALCYVPAARVLHSHERGPRYELARTFAVHRRLGELFELRTIPDLGSLGRAIVSSLALHRTLARGAGWRERLRALGLAVVWPLGQYLGGLAHERGWKLRARGV